jgi:hypothetical protein
MIVETRRLTAKWNEEEEDKTASLNKQKKLQEHRCDSFSTLLTKPGF